jgi:hypothetical protein
MNYQTVTADNIDVTPLINDARHEIARVLAEAGEFANSRDSYNWLLMGCHIVLLRDDHVLSRAELEADQAYVVVRNFIEGPEATPWRGGLASRVFARSREEQAVVEVRP